MKKLVVKLDLKQFDDLMSNRISKMKPVLDFIKNECKWEEEEK